MFLPLVLAVCFLARLDLCLPLYITPDRQTATYDHRNRRTSYPVRSSLYKPVTGGLVVKWVTIGESPLLYVFAFGVGVGSFFFKLGWVASFLHIPHPNCQLPHTTTGTGELATPSDLAYINRLPAD